MYKLSIYRVICNFRPDYFIKQHEIVWRSVAHFAYFLLMVTCGKTTEQHHNQDIGIDTIYPSYPGRSSFTYISSVCGLNSLDSVTCAGLCTHHYGQSRHKTFQHRDPSCCLFITIHIHTSVCYRNMKE